MKTGLVGKALSAILDFTVSSIAWFLSDFNKFSKTARKSWAV
jgi:hypothetical protein